MRMKVEKEYIHPTYLGWQVDWPLFVKMPFTAYGKYWKRGEHFNWHTQHGAEADKVAHLYASGYVHHNPTREKEEKVGDRLYELEKEDFKDLTRLVNAEIKKLTANDTEYNRKKIKQSAILDKQRGLIRSWLRNNPSFKSVYDDKLEFVLEKKTKYVEPQE